MYKYRGLFCHVIYLMEIKKNKLYVKPEDQMVL